MLNLNVLFNIFTILRHFVSISLRQQQLLYIPNNLSEDKTDLRTRKKQLTPPLAPPSRQDFPLPFGNLNRQSAQIILLTNLKAGSGSVRLGYFLFFYKPRETERKKMCSRWKSRALWEKASLLCTSESVLSAGRMRSKSVSLIPGGKREKMTPAVELCSFPSSHGK